MISKIKLNRINELAKKSKDSGLNDKEKDEQQQLRKEYLKNVRGSFKNHLKNMKIVDPMGADVTPQKLKDYQNREKNNH